MTKQERDERRRMRTWMAAQVLSALIRRDTIKHDTTGELARNARFITDVMLEELDSTDPYKE